MKYLGVLVLLIGALLLIGAGVSSSLSNNTVLCTGLMLVIVGYLAHILLGRLSK